MVPWAAPVSPVITCGASVATGYSAHCSCGADGGGGIGSSICWNLGAARLVCRRQCRGEDHPSSRPFPVCSVNQCVSVGTEPDITRENISQPTPRCYTVLQVRHAKDNKSDRRDGNVISSWRVGFRVPAPIEGQLSSPPPPWTRSTSATLTSASIFPHSGFGNVVVASKTSSTMHFDARAVEDDTHAE